MPILSTASRLWGGCILAVALGMGMVAPGYAQCWSGPARRYAIDPLLLLAIAQVESSMDSHAVNQNRDGTWDLGLMQINSANFPWLATLGFEREQMTNYCTAIAAGAAVLSGFIDRHGYNWNAVGAYNAGSAPSRAGARRRYAFKVWQVYRRLLRDPGEQDRLLARWKKQR